MLLLLPFICFILVIAFNRYVPVRGVQAVQEINEGVVLVDLRNYQISYNNPIPGALHIPYAYLKRHYQKIPNKDLIIITSDKVERNLAVRFLRKKNYKVIGYMTDTEKQQLDFWQSERKRKIV